MADNRGNSAVDSAQDLGHGSRPQPGPGPAAPFEESSALTEEIVIIGAGQAGLQAVASLRAEGYDGTITLLGDEPYSPYQRPPLSKAYLAGDLERERLFLRPETFYEDSRCTLLLGVRVERIDRAARTIHCAGGSSLPYTKLLLATGTRTRPLSIAGAGLEGVRCLRTIADADALRPHLTPGAKLVIVGAGYIGLEVAAVACKRGVAVTVIEFLDRVMPRTASPPLSAFYEQVHREAGVEIIFGSTMELFEGTTHVEAVRTRDACYAADCVLVAVGVLPNVELAQAADLACDNGIVVDACARTSDPNIFAAGDCTNHPVFDGKRARLESVQNAIDQAKAAAAGLAGNPRPYHEVPWFWSDQYDLKLQIAGLPRPDDEIVLRGDPAAHTFAVFHLREGVLAAVEAVNMAPEYVAGRRLIASGRLVAAAALADPAVPMKTLV